MAHLRVVGGSIPPKTVEMRVKYYRQYQGHLFFFYNEKKNAASPGFIRRDLGVLLLGVLG